MRRIAIALIAVLFTATGLSQAQQQSKWEVYGGFTLMRVSGYPNLYGANTANENNGTYDLFGAFNVQGGGFAASYFPSKHVGVTADFSFAGKNAGISGTSESANTQEDGYLFGPTVRFGLKGTGGRITLFAHQLFGISHTTLTFSPSSNACYESSSTSKATCSANPFTLASGGGVDIAITSHISVRPAELDYWAEQLKSETFLGQRPVHGNRFGQAGREWIPLLGWGRGEVLSSRDIA